MEDLQSLRAAIIPLLRIIQSGILGRTPSLRTTLYRDLERILLSLLALEQTSSSTKQESKQT